MRSSMKTFFVVVLFQGTLTIHQGALTVELDGVETELHVIAAADKSQELFVTDGAELKLKWDGELRGFLGSSAMDEMPLSNYHNFTLFNKEVSYDIDLGKVGCSCNAALFFVSMPGFNQDGSMAQGNDPKLPWYCDATGIGGVLCWEHDTIEGNQYTMGVTPHKCNASPGQYITECHQRGCQSNVFLEDPKAFCPDSACKIDTRFPFRIIQQYVADATMTTLARITTRLAQHDNTFEWDTCAEPDYLQELAAPFKGNWTMTFQLWGNTEETMRWLDGPTGCTGDCVQGETETTFSNLVIRSLGQPAEDAVVVV